MSQLSDCQIIEMRKGKSNTSSRIQTGKKLATRKFKFALLARDLHVPAHACLISRDLIQIVK
jgi:hypothetical protein